MTHPGARIGRLSGVAVLPAMALLSLVAGMPAGAIGASPRAVPGFCMDRMPSAETLRMAGATLPSTYPARPQDVDATLNGSVDFHPLQALLPYLVTVDNRAQLGLVSSQIDGAAITGLINFLDQSHRIQWRDGIASLVYTFPADGVPAPFVSSMTQSGLAYLASVAFVLTGDPYDFTVARAALRSFVVDYRDGGVRVARAGGGAWYEEYAAAGLAPDKLIYVLNGFTYALDNLAKMMAIGMGERLPELTEVYADGVHALLDALPAYDTGFDWSYYDATGQNRATASYHAYETVLLRELACHDSDARLASAADRFWAEYRQQMPYRLLSESGGTTTYGHFAGIFPHAYLRDENATRLIAVDGRGGQSPVSVQSLGGYVSEDGRPEFDTATIPAGTRSLEVWWFSDQSILGVPSLYRVDSLPIPGPGASASIGRWVGCDGAHADLGPVIASTDILAVRDSDAQPNGGGTDACIRLDAGIAPSRITIAVPVERIQVANRASAVTQGPDPSLATISVGPPGDLTGYQAGQATILLTGLSIDPTSYPDLELPIGFRGLTALVIDAVAADGTRITRYLPSSDRSVSGQPLVVTWPSFPGYAAKVISSIAIRASVSAEDVDPIEIGQPTLASGSDALMTDRNALGQGGSIYKLTQRSPNLGVRLSFYSRVNTPIGSPGAEPPAAATTYAPGLPVKILVFALATAAVVAFLAAHRLRRRARRAKGGAS